MSDGGGFNQDRLLARLAETFRGVRFGRGVVARTGHAMLGLLIVWGIVAWRWTDNLASDGGLLVVGLAASVVYWSWMKSTQRFAERNPAQAMLEGAEFIEYQKFEAQVKGLPPGRSALQIEGSAVETPPRAETK